MHSQNFSRVFILIAFVLVALACGAAVFFAVSGRVPNIFSGTEFTIPPHSPVLTAGVPVRIMIPKIQVDAAIEAVGVTAKGAMEVPQDPDDGAWFNLGVRPGQKGSAVIAGHLNWKGGAKGVFEKLEEVEKGDKIFVSDESGAVITFVVTETRVYDAKDDSTEVFSSNDGKSHLNLITCEGAWNASVSSYSERLVVFAERE